MRLFLLVALTLLLGGLYLCLDGILEMRWWVETRPEQTQLQWQGWEAALHAWPLVLVGVLVGGGMVWALFGWAYGHAEEYDHAKEIEQVQQERAALEGMRSRIYAEIEQKDAALKVREQALYQQLAEAYEERDKAKQKAKNASFAHERKVKQLAALKDATGGEHA